MIGARLTWQLKTDMKIEMRRAAPGGASGAGSTERIVPSAGETIVSSPPGGRAFGVAEELQQEEENEKREDRQDRDSGEEGGRRGDEGGREEGPALPRDRNPQWATPVAVGSGDRLHLVLQEELFLLQTLLFDLLVFG